jgi:putative heme iron utilization protein
MKTIQEIFATNPSLLETKEVKEMLQQSRAMMQSIADKHNNFRHEVSEILFESEVFIIDGRPSNEVINDLLDKVL